MVIVRVIAYKLADNCVTYEYEKPPTQSTEVFVFPCLGSPLKICKVTLGSLVSLPVFMSHKGQGKVIRAPSGPFALFAMSCKRGLLERDFINAWHRLGALASLPVLAVERGTEKSITSDTALAPCQCLGGKQCGRCSSAWHHVGPRAAPPRS